MAYVSLYRKYRPQTFGDVVGQKHVIASLRSAIEQDAVGHAYLFAGPRGTGKTTIARILAMAVNAPGGPTPDPDPDDPVSTAIRQGSAMDVIELDMASHGGVDDARELRDRAAFAPVELRKKVYILDEVHMASQAAFNALLKLIEEPPPHVMFAMATTDPQKVLPTILSRVQRLDLRRVGAADLGEHVRRLADLEGFSVDDGALGQVLRAGEGSVRDTLSVLEQVFAYASADGRGEGATAVTEEHAAAVLGRTPVARCFEVVDHLDAGDIAGTFALVQGLLDDGHDLRRFTLDLVGHLRDLLVVQAAPDRPDLIDAAQAHRDALVDQATRWTRERLVFAVDVLGSILVEQRTGPPRLPLELALARLAVPEASGDVAALASRVSALEQGAPRAPRASAPARPAPAAPSGPAPSGPAPAAPEPAPADPAPEVTAVPEPAPAPTAASEAADEASAAEPAATAAPDPAPEPEADSAPPAASEPAAGPAAGSGGDVDLATLVQQWDAILEVVSGNSRKAHAMFMHGQPSRLSRGVLTLEYPSDKSFHRENATQSDIAAVLRGAVEQVCGIRVAIDAVEQGKVDRRPGHPEVTPSDARVAVDPISGGDPERGSAVTASEPQTPPPTATSPSSSSAGPSAEAAAPPPSDEPSPPPPGARDDAPSAPPPAPAPPPEPVDEQALVREAEHETASGPDHAQAVATIVEVLGATEVDESELA